MTERPILFSGPLVRAILDGRKTQTRRLVRFPANCDPECFGGWQDGVAYWDAMAVEIPPIRCPFGKPGDRLWVRETWRPKRVSPETDGDARTVAVMYAADEEVRTHTVGVDIGWHEVGRMLDRPGHWIPSMSMPRWAARLFLTVESVRVERLQAISHDDAEREGVELGGRMNYRQAFAALWDSLAPEGSRWDANPWVWVVTFKREGA